MSVSKGCIIMADVKLSRPASGQQLVIPSAPDARLILDFPADQVSIDRPEGSSSLFFQFEDGASIELQNFYGAYNKEALPEFEVDGQLIAGTDFFEAFGPDLVPAAGPAAAERGARYSEYSNMGLAEGVWHLNELDYRLAFDGPQADDQWAYGVLDNVAPTFSTGGAPITLGLTETGWDGKSTVSPAPVSTSGSFTVRDPDGDSLTATVSIGGKTVAVSLDGPTTVESDYGTLVITPSGRGSNITFDFKYTLKEEPYSKTDRLAQGEQVTDGIVISVNDGMGHTVTQPINVVITGSNDAPDIEGVDDFVLKDQGVWAGGERSTTLNSNENNPITKAGTDVGQFKLADGGKIVAVDPDHGDKLTYDFVSMTIGGKTTIFDSTHAVSGELPNGFTKGYVVEDYGKLYVNSETGDYRFELNTATGDSVDRLAEDEAVTISFTPSVTDMHGALSLQDGAPGIMRDGTPTPGGGAVDITIHGSNEAPTISQTATWDKGGVLVEKGVDIDGTASISGTFVATDVDNGDTLHYRLVGTNNDLHETLYLVKDTVTGGIKLVSTPGSNGDADYYGKVNIDQNGKYTVELFNDSEAVQELRGDGTTDKTFTFTVAAQDSKGAYVAQNVTGNIEGTNDAPKIVWGSIHLREEGVWNNGLWNNSNDKTVSDGKNNDGFTDDKYHRTEVTGQLIASDVDNDKNELRYSIDVTSGSGLKEKFPFEFKSNVTGEKLTISILGTEDSETQQIIKTNYGDLVLDKVSGKFTFTLGGDANALSKGESFQFHFTTVVSDGNATNNHQLAITIEGANDKPTLTFVGGPGVDSGDLEVTEAGFGVGHKAVSGNVQGDDPDSDSKGNLSFGLTTGHQDGVDGRNEAFAPADKQGMGEGVSTVKGVYGTLTIAKDGTYTYELDEDAADSLAAGASAKDEFTIYVRDQYGAWDAKPITVAITGSNDAPKIATQESGWVKESGVFYAGDRGDSLNSLENTSEVEDTTIFTGIVTATDVDTGDMAKLTFGLASTTGGSPVNGTIYVTSINPNGTFDFVTEKPANDAYFGTLRMETVSDVNGDKKGQYTFELNNVKGSPADALGENDVVTLKVYPTVSDGLVTVNGANPIEITIKGTNDVPTITNTPAGLVVTEAGFGVAGEDDSKKITAQDVDTGDTFSYHLTLGGDAATLDGAALHDELFVVGVYDQGGKPVLDANGQLKIELSADPVIGKTYGKLTMDSDGNYAFTLDNDADIVQKMTAGNRPSLDFSVAVVDSKGAYDHKTVTLTINGSNDAPYMLSQYGTGTVKDNGVYSGDAISPTTLNSKELTPVTKIKGADNAPTVPGLGDFKQSVSGFVKAEDYEHDTLTYSLKGATSFPDSTTVPGGVPKGYDADNCTTITNEYGTLYLNKSDGSYTFVLDMDSEKTKANSLGEDQSADVNFTVIVNDGHGGKSFTNAITINIKGTNDAPVLETLEWNNVNGIEQNEITQNVKNPSDLTQISGTVTATDVDANDKSNLEFFFVVDGKNAIATTVYVNLDGTLTTEKPTGDYLGSLTMTSANDKGTYTFTLNNDSPTVKAMGEADHQKISFDIAVRDPRGAYDVTGGEGGPSKVTLTITGGDDPTVIDTEALGQQHDLIEKGVRPKSTVTDAQAKGYQDDSSGILEAKGRLHATDVDTADQAQLNTPTCDARLHYCIVDSAGKEHDLNQLMGTSNAAFTIATPYGTLTITPTNGDGFNYTYAIDNTNPTVEKMNLGDQLPDNFTLFIRDTDNTTSDPLGAIKSVADVKITIRGANDRPELDVVPSKEESATIVETSIGKIPMGQVQVADAEEEIGSTGTTPVYEAVDADKGFTFSLVAGKDSHTTDSPVMQGTYGRLIIDQATGKYRYELTKDVSALAEGSHVEDVFYVRVKDADGAYSEIKPITITINGKDTLGTLTGNHLTITEEGVTGNVQGILHWDGNNKLGANTSVTIIDKGQIKGALSVHDLDDNKFDNNAGVTGKADNYSEYTFENVTAKLGDKVVTVTQGDGKYVIEEYGTLTLNASGEYTFEANYDSSAFNALAEGESVVVTVPVTAIKDSGNADQNVKGALQITIKGTNDAPVVEAMDSSFIDDYTDVFTGGQETASFTTLADPATAITYLTDHPDLIKAYVTQGIGNIMQEVKSHSGIIGDIIGLLNGWGGVQEWLTRVANGAAKTLDDFGRLDNLLTKLNLGHDVSSFLATAVGSERVIVVDSDETAAWSNGSLFSSASGDPVVRGTLNTANLVTDVDHGSSLTFFALEKGNSGNLVQEIKGEYGTLIISPNGTYQYVLDRAGCNYQNYVKNHASGDSTTEKFTIYVRDEHNAVAEKPIELIINVGKMGDGIGGDNTKATSGNLQIKSVTDNVQEDGLIDGQPTGKTIAVGSVTSSNPDKYDANLFLIDGDGNKTSVISNEYGTITLLPDGTYTYTLNNDSPAVQGLKGTDEVLQTFKVKNGSGEKEITITIKGTNDAPYIVQEASGVAIAESISGGGNKTWGASSTGTFIVNDVDKDELALLKPSGPNVTAEGDRWTVTGDKGGTFTVTKVADGQFTYTYKAPEGDESVNYRGIVEDTAELTLANGSGDKDEVTVDLKASLDYANDKPSFIKDGNGNILLDAEKRTVIEDGGAQMVARGEVQATDSDVDSSGREDAGSLTYTIKDSTTGMLDYLDEKTGEKLGTLIMGKDGSYEFHLNTSSETVQALGKGETKDITFEIQVSDGHGGTATAPLVITIKGTNDVPVISLHTVTVVEGESIEGVAGSGAMLYTTDPGDSVKETGAVSGKAQFTDRDAGETLTITVTTLNDAVSKSITVLDEGVPTNEELSIKGKYGTLEFKADGTYTYTPGHSLGKDETGEDTFTITVTDAADKSAKQTLTVGVTGANDTPTITVEGGNLVYADPDTNDTLSLSVVYGGTGYAVTPESEGATKGNATIAGVGTFTFIRADANSQWTSYTFLADVALAAAIRAGEHGDNIHVQMKVSDQYNATGDVSVTVKALGTNAAPVPLPAADTPEWGGTLAWDPDGDSLTFTHDTQSATGIHDLTFGKLVVDADGAYRYTLNMDEATMEHLSEQTLVNGSIHEKSFAFTVDDHATEGIPVEGSLNIKIDVDNWDGDKGILLFGDAGSNTLDGGSGNDILSGGGGDDTLYGNGGDDYLFGGAGDDYLFGGAGDDYLFGGSGNDFLDGGEGNNHLYGGDGNDVLVFHQGDTIDGGADFDMLVVKGGSVDGLFTGAEHAKGVDSITGVEVMVSTSGDALNNLTDMAEIASKTGVSISTGSDGSTAVSFDASHTWTTTMQTASNGTLWEVYSTTITTDSGNDETVQVAVQHLTTSLGG